MPSRTPPLPVTDVPFDFPCPTEAAALESFERVLGGEARTVWDRACAAVGHPPPRPPLTLPQLREVAEHLSRQDGFVGVLGTSLRIRIATYETLSAPGDGN